MTLDPPVEPDSPTEREHATPTNNRTQTVNAILLALVSLLGAFVVWRASVASDAAGDETLAGILATLNAEEVRALSAIEFYEDYRAFTGYTRYNAIGDHYAAELEAAGDAEAPQLESAMVAAWDAAESFDFPRRYLNRDGTYNVERQLGEAWADAARQKDLEPAPHFADAAHMQGKSSNLIAVATLLAVALVAHTLAEAADRQRLKLLLLGTGIVLSMASLTALAAVEAGIWS